MAYDPTIHQRAAFLKADIQRYRDRAKTLGWKEARFRGSQRLIQRICEAWLISSPKVDPEPKESASRVFADLEARVARLERNVRMEVE